MKKTPKPLSTKKPPLPTADHYCIEEWIENSTMPKMKPLVIKIDALIRKLIPNLHYSIKWSKAYYGTEELGWIIEVAPNHITTNIVFLKGAEFDTIPPLGEGIDSRYTKLTSLDDADKKEIRDWILEAGRTQGWK